MNPCPRLASLAGLLLATVPALALADSVSFPLDVCSGDGCIYAIPPTLVTIETTQSKSGRVGAKFVVTTSVPNSERGLFGLYFNARDRRGSEIPLVLGTVNARSNCAFPFGDNQGSLANGGAAGQNPLGAFDYFLFEPEYACSLVFSVFAANPHTNLNLREFLHPVSGGTAFISTYFGAFGAVGFLGGNTAAPSVPEPPSLPLLATGLLALFLSPGGCAVARGVFRDERLMK